MRTRRTKTVTIKRHQPYNFTLAVAPSEIGSRGIHDVRVVFLEQETPRQDQTFAGRSVSHTTRAFRLYYGGCKVVRPVSKSFPDATNVRPTRNLWTHMNSATPKRMLLFPGSERQKLKDNNNTWELTLGSTFEIRDSSVQMEALVAGSGFFGKSGRNYYVVLDGTEPVAGLRGLGDRIPRAPGSIPADTNRKFANRLRFELPLPDERLHRIRLLSFHHPNGDWTEIDTSPTSRSSYPVFVERNK